MQFNVRNREWFEIKDKLDAEVYITASPGFLMGYVERLFYYYRTYCNRCLYIKYYNKEPKI